MIFGNLFKGSAQPAQPAPAVKIPALILMADPFTGDGSVRHTQNKRIAIYASKTPGLWDAVVEVNQRVAQKEIDESFGDLDENLEDEPVYLDDGDGMMTWLADTVFPNMSAAGLGYQLSSKVLDDSERATLQRFVREHAPTATEMAARHQ